MAKDLALDGLENEVETVETTATDKSVAKQEKIVSGVEKIKTLSVSEDLAKFLPAALVWGAGDAEAKDAAKAELIESFGGVEALKDLCSGDALSTEIDELNNVKVAVSAINTIKHFYARRAGGKARSKKVKTQTISINDEMYSVDQAYLIEIQDKDASEKKELLLAHPNTKKEVDMISL